MRIRLIAVLSALLLLAAGCGGNGDDTSSSSSGGDSGSGGGMTLKIVEPAEGTSVNAPFTVKVEASVPLGKRETGLHHIHVWYDDHADQYQVVEADHVDVKSGELSSGQHVIHASLRNANHSAAGAEAQETVMVGDAGAPAPATTPTGGGDGGYGY
jgi:hypothetical protein